MVSIKKNSREVVVAKIPKIQTYTPGRYLLFSGTYYYPRGGIGDFDEAFATIEAAIAFCNQSDGRRECEFVHIVDVKEGVIFELEKDALDAASWPTTPWRLPRDDGDGGTLQDYLPTSDEA